MSLIPLFHSLGWRLSVFQIPFVLSYLQQVLKG